MNTSSDDITRDKCSESLHYLSSLARRVTPPPPFITCGDPKIDESVSTIEKLITKMFDHGQDKLSRI